jgi:hypothetical protein
VVRISRKDLVRIFGTRRLEAIDMEPTRIYHAADSIAVSRRRRVVRRRDHQGIDGRIVRAFVRARKPAAAEKRCCGPTCCS